MDFSYLNLHLYIYTQIKSRLVSIIIIINVWNILQDAELWYDMRQIIFIKDLKFSYSPFIIH